MRREGNVYYRGGQYLRAVAIYQSGYESALRRGDSHSAVRFLNNLGSAYYQMFRYRDAIGMYLTARDLAAAQHDSEMLSALSVNLSSLYYQMGETDASMESAKEGLRAMGNAAAAFKPKLLIQRALLADRQKKWEEAAVLLREALEASRALADLSSESQAWNELGDTRLHEGRVADAERALLEAYRLRKLTHDDRLFFTYQSLANLRLRQGDSETALVFFDRAIEASRSFGPAASWNVYYERGEARLAAGLPGEAYADFGVAVESAKRWRAEVLPADAFRVSTEVEVHRAYSAFIELGSRLHRQSGQARFAAQSFAAAEESRAASLRALWAGRDLTRKLPPEYWQALSDLYRAEAAVMTDGAEAGAASVRGLRTKVAEIEARAGLDLPRTAADSDAGASLLERTGRLLAPTEAYLGFHLGDSESCLWAVTRGGFELRRLPARSDLAENIGHFVKALSDDSPEAAALGRRLYDQLFGGVSRGVLEKPVWILAPDGPLFELPFAALLDHSGQYVIERHAAVYVTGAPSLFDASSSAAAGPFVGLSDPIYNRADPRLKSQPSTAPPRRSSRPNSPPMELARLAGSARELKSCARIWRSCGHAPILLEGAAANRENLLEALRQEPAVVHVAAHIVFPPASSGPGAIALSLRAGSQLELVGATEIGNLRANLGLVVLNGCSSGEAAILPGAGLMGMTRAWLAAGARAVIATRWATADPDDGALFTSLYSRVPAGEGRAGRGAFAQLLQRAQLDALRGGGRHASPAYWAAYFCVERS